MIQKIGQLVDSSGNLPRDIIAKYDIKEVPLTFTFGGQKYYRENIDYSNNDFYLHMKEYPEQVPRTSAVNVNDWLKALEELYQKGCRRFIISTISSKLSATFQNAGIACNDFLSAKKDAEVELIDTNSCACGQAALEIKIAHLIKQSNLSWDDIVKRIKKIIPQVNSLFSVQELTYMKAGGRIGGATAFLGNLIKIKPVCEFINGEVQSLKAVRGRKKSLIYLTDLVASRITNINHVVIVTQNALCNDDEDFMIDYLRSKLNYQDEIYRGFVGTTVGAHSGPGSIGIGFIEERL